MPNRNDWETVSSLQPMSWDYPFSPPKSSEVYKIYSTTCVEDFHKVMKFRRGHCHLKTLWYRRTLHEINIFRSFFWLYSCFVHNLIIIFYWHIWWIDAPIYDLFDTGSLDRNVPLNESIISKIKLWSLTYYALWNMLWINYRTDILTEFISEIKSILNFNCISLVLLIFNWLYQN